MILYEPGEFNGGRFEVFNTRHASFLLFDEFNTIRLMQTDIDESNSVGSLYLLKLVVALGFLQVKHSKSMESMTLGFLILLDIRHASFSIF